MARQTRWFTHVATGVSSTEPTQTIDLLDDGIDNEGRTVVRVIGGWTGLARNDDMTIRTFRMRLGIAHHVRGSAPDVFGTGPETGDWLYYAAETLVSSLAGGEAIQQIDAAGQLAKVDTEAARRLTTNETVSVITGVQQPPGSSWSAGAFFWRCLVLEPPATDE